MRILRKKRQELTKDRTIKIMENSSHGVLAIIGDGGYPYAVPLSFAYSGGKIYFHCAKVGHKLDAIKSDGRVSFCAVARDEIMPKDFTTKYESAVAFGRARIIEDRDEIIYAMRLLARKYCPQTPAAIADKYIKSDMSRFFAVCIDVEHMTGKQGSMLVKEEMKEKF